MHQVQDGERVALGARTLELIHTPGHALHHYAVVDAAHASIFPGDTFGISYRALDTAQGAFIFPTTTPTQFDPQQLVASIDRMLSYQPESMYLMHFSRVTDVARLGASLMAQVLRAGRAGAQRTLRMPIRPPASAPAMCSCGSRPRVRHGCRQSDAQLAELLAGDLELNTQGLVVWLQRGASADMNEHSSRPSASIEGGQDRRAASSSISLEDLVARARSSSASATRASTTRTRSPPPARARSCAAIRSSAASILPAWSSPRADARYPAGR